MNFGIAIIGEQKTAHDRCKSNWCKSDPFCHFKSIVYQSTLFAFNCEYIFYRSWSGHIAFFLILLLSLTQILHFCLSFWIGQTLSYNFCLFSVAEFILLWHGFYFLFNLRFICLQHYIHVLERDSWRYYT